MNFSLFCTAIFNRYCYDNFLSTERNVQLLNRKCVSEKRGQS